MTAHKFWSLFRGLHQDKYVCIHNARSVLNVWRHVGVVTIVSVAFSWNEPVSSSTVCVMHAVRRHSVALLMLGGGVIDGWGSNVSLSLWWRSRILLMVLSYSGDKSLPSSLLILRLGGSSLMSFTRLYTRLSPCRNLYFDDIVKKIEVFAKLIAQGMQTFLRR